MRYHQKLGILFVIVFLLDQLSKLVSRRVGIAQLNTGGILGRGAEYNWVIIMVIALSVTIWYLYKSKSNAYQKAVWILIISSGLSNLFDRFIWGGVWDWIVYPVINVIGNIADILLGIGLGLLLFELQLRSFKNRFITHH